MRTEAGRAHWAHLERAAASGSTPYVVVDDIRAIEREARAIALFDALEAIRLLPMSAGKPHLLDRDVVLEAVGDLR